ncbi:MAG: hypothetical protein JWM25_838, partial [Thermoleophilia bacterium]|nr:hypothetical protein [Thermoleophilia bacterium]
IIALARRIWRPRVEPPAAVDAYHSLISGDGDAVDHTRSPGVPPPSNDDYSDPTDHDSADSFPASDPPAHW